MYWGLIWISHCQILRILRTQYLYPWGICLYWGEQGAKNPLKVIPVTQSTKSLHGEQIIYVFWCRLVWWIMKGICKVKRKSSLFHNETWKLAQRTSMTVIECHVNAIVEFVIFCVWIFHLEWCFDIHPYYYMYH